MVQQGSRPSERALGESEVRQVPSEAVTRVVEPMAFSDAYATFCDAIDALGHERLIWDDERGAGARLRPANRAVVFHGSLGAADRVRRALPWTPGAFCAAEAFCCSAWYPRASAWLLNRRWKRTTVAALVADPLGVAGALAVAGRVFVRPDSPLKPFSGRVCALDDLSLAALDFGFYYGDPSTPVIVAPVEPVEREWRFVVASNIAAARPS